MSLMQCLLVAHALLTGQLAIKHSWPRGSAAGAAENKRQIVALGISKACTEETGQAEYIIKKLHHPDQVKGGGGKGREGNRGKWGGMRRETKTREEEEDE